MTTVALLVGAFLWAALTILIASYVSHGWVRPRRQATPVATPISSLTTESSAPAPHAAAASPGTAVPAYGVGEARLEGLAKTPHDRRAATLVLVAMGLVLVVVGVGVVRTGISPVGGGGAIVLGFSMVFVWSRRRS